MSSININIGVNMSPGDRFNFGYSGGISAATITVPAGYFYLYNTTTPVATVNRTSDATPDLTCHTAFVGNVNYQFTYDDTSSVSINKNNTTNKKIISTLLNLWYGLPANKVTHLRHDNYNPTSVKLMELGKDQGNDRIAKLYIDLFGISYLYAECTAASNIKPLTILYSASNLG